MGVFYETLPPSLVTWLLEQKVYWIGSAPLSGSGHINVSPKGVTDRGGGPFFGVIKESKSIPGKVLSSTSTDADDNNGKDVVIKKFWYMDLTGSGIETTSHLHEPGNGRITVMFMAFDGPPRILRIYGKGECNCDKNQKHPKNDQNGRLRPRLVICCSIFFHLCTG